MKSFRTLPLVLALLAAPAARAQFEGVVEMKMTSAHANGTVKAWVSKVGTRSEMAMQAAEMKRSGMSGDVKMVSIVKFADPDTVVFVNDGNRTYSVMNTKQMRESAKGMTREEESYTVQKGGRDSVAGFSCQNAVVTGSSGTRMEMCVSSEILGGASLLRSMERGGGNRGALVKALKDAGLDGMPVRMVTRPKGNGGDTVTVELVSAHKQSVPAATFEVPAGYQKSDMFLPMSNPDVDRKMKEAMERMTPEQRKAFEQMMKQRSGGN